MPNPIAVLLLLVATLPLAAEVTFESLGHPASNRELTVEAATVDDAGKVRAWGVVQGHDWRGAAGIDVETGEVLRVNVLEHGNSNVRMAKGADGNVYLYSGIPGRFLRIDRATGAVTDLGAPSPHANYWMRSFVDDDRFFVGTYPRTELVSVNMATGEVTNHGRMTEDTRQRYIVDTVVSRDNVAYCSVGLHHRELWSLDLDTGERRQILPEAMTEAQGAPSLWPGPGGAVYGASGNKTFRCHPDRIEMVEEAPRSRDNTPRIVNDTVYWRVNEDGELLYERLGGEEQRLATEYPGVPLALYSVGPLVDGVLYGSSIKPGYLWTMDPATGEFTNHGTVTGGRIQIYDFLPTAHGVFLASYVGASIDVLDPGQPIKRGTNPKGVVQFSREFMQERPYQLIEGPDGMVYVATVPVKGHLGGALGRIDPETLEATAWRNVVPNQSFWTLAPVPETGEILLASSVGGGSSAIPTEDEAVIALWDPKTETVTHTAKPLPGTRTYRGVTRAPNGVIYGVADDKYFAFDPVKREVLHTGDLPDQGLRFPALHDTLVGGLVYGIAGTSLYAIDPADHSVKVVAQDPRLKAAHGYWIGDDGTIYVNSGSELLRGRLPQD